MRIRWPRFQYSLRTLLLGVYVIGSGMWVCKDWDPWALTAEVRGCNPYSPPPVFSPDGRTIVTAAAYSNACLAIWDCSTGRLAGVADMAAPAPSGVATVPKRLAFSHGGRYLWGAYGESGFRLWNLETQQEMVCEALKNSSARL
ncbi:MAG: hypothetical protein NTW87_29225, partial [Planctomycetota bacterium]|nr:hypothetical protein [Planctomycetota bacterium]